MPHWKAEKLEVIEFGNELCCGAGEMRWKWPNKAGRAEIHVFFVNKYLKFLRFKNKQKKSLTQKNGAWKWRKNGKKLSFLWYLFIYAKNTDDGDGP